MRNCWSGDDFDNAHKNILLPRQQFSFSFSPVLMNEAEDAAPSLNFN